MPIRRKMTVLEYLRIHLLEQATLHSHDKSRSHTARGPGIMPAHRQSKMAGNKIWRKMREGKLGLGR